MITAARCVALLDSALAIVGEDVRLQRLSSDAAGVQTVVAEVTCRGTVNDASPSDLIGMPGEAPAALIILSPTQIADAGWPGPPVKDDRVLIQGDSGTWRPGNVEIVNLFRVGGDTVRIELQCRGFITA